MNVIGIVSENLTFYGRHHLTSPTRSQYDERRFVDKVFHFPFSLSPSFRLIPRVQFSHDKNFLAREKKFVCFPIYFFLLKPQPECVRKHLFD